MSITERKGNEFSGKFDVVAEYNFSTKYYYGIICGDHYVCFSDLGNIHVYLFPSTNQKIANLKINFKVHNLLLKYCESR